MKLYQCQKENCNNIAVWMYAPMDSEGFFCDDHVSRGCSCNIDPDTGIEDQDEQGRFYPCCEFMYNENGFEND